MNEETRFNKDYGKKIKVVLPNQIFYNGKIINEDETFIFIIDKFGSEVRLNKSQIISMEVVNDGS